MTSGNTVKSDLLTRLWGSGSGSSRARRTLFVIGLVVSCHGAVRSWLRLHGAETGLFRVHEENVQDKLRSLPFQLHACKVDVSDQSVMFGHVWASEQGRWVRLFSCGRGALPRPFLALLNLISSI